MILPAVQVAIGGEEQVTTAGYTAGMLVGAACTAGAPALSLLIPRPATAEADGRESRDLEDVR